MGSPAIEGLRLRVRTQTKPVLDVSSASRASAGGVLNLPATELFAPLLRQAAALHPKGFVSGHGFSRAVNRLCLTASAAEVHFSRLRRLWCTLREVQHDLFLSCLTIGEAYCLLEVLGGKPHNRRRGKSSVGQARLLSVANIWHKGE
jgi:hypothetical protein